MLAPHTLVVQDMRLHCRCHESNPCIDRLLAVVGSFAAVGMTTALAFVVAIVEDTARTPADQVHWELMIGKA